MTCRTSYSAPGDCHVDRRGPARRASTECQRCGASQLRTLLEAMVANGFEIEEVLLQHPTRGESRIALARQVAMYLAHVACGLSKAEAGKLFGRDRTTVHHACMVIEERRDDEVFNRALDHLELVIRIVVGPSSKEAACHTR